MKNTLLLSLPLSISILLITTGCGEKGKFMGGTQAPVVVTAQPTAETQSGDCVGDACNPSDSSNNENSGGTDGGTTAGGGTDSGGGTSGGGTDSGGGSGGGYSGGGNSGGGNSGGGNSGGGNSGGGNSGGGNSGGGNTGGPAEPPPSQQDLDDRKECSRRTFVPENKIRINHGTGTMELNAGESMIIILGGNAGQSRQCFRNQGSAAAPAVAPVEENLTFNFDGEGSMPALCIVMRGNSSAVFNVKLPIIKFSVDNHGNTDAQVNVSDRGSLPQNKMITLKGSSVLDIHSGSSTLHYSGNGK